MASISTGSNGRVAIQFKAPNGKRRSIRLGKIDPRVAEEVKDQVEHLAGCWRDHRPPCLATDEWVSELQADQGRLWLYDRLAAVGLVAERPGSRRKRKKGKGAEDSKLEKLGAFLDAYISGRKDLKEGTITNMHLVRRRLVEKFGEDCQLKDVTPGDGDDWRIWLTGKLGENTTRRYCGRAKQFFRAAVRKRLIQDNPFGDMKGCNVQANRERDFFVERTVSARIIAACPNAEWRLIFALSRYGGLRCPSEHSLLTWDDVDWERSRFTVHSPKTEHHEGKESRVVPLFPELRPYLEEAFELAEPGSVHVITRCRNPKANLRTQLLRILKRAGVKAWPKLFQNLRASRATELAAEYPAHVAAAWLGHSEKIAEAHYWQVTDADFQRAAVECTGGGWQKAVQNAVQIDPKTGANRAKSGASEIYKYLQDKDLHDSQMTPTGSEQMAFSLGKPGCQGEAVHKAVHKEPDSWLDAYPLDLDEPTREIVLERVDVGELVSW